MSRIAIAAIRAYQRLLSPVLGANCRFEPSCSVYGAQAIEHHGVLRGVSMTLWRILRCNPFSGGGYDPPVRPLPENAAERALDEPPDEVRAAS